jgi:hypothetical protein
MVAQYGELPETIDGKLERIQYEGVESSVVQFVIQAMLG